MSDAAKVGILSQIAAAERELALRNNVYPKRVAEGKMKPDDMALEIKRMQAIVATLRFVKDNEDGFREFVAARKTGAQAKRPFHPKYSTPSLIEELQFAMVLYESRAAAVSAYRRTRLKAVIEALEAV